MPVIFTACLLSVSFVTSSAFATGEKKDEKKACTATKSENKNELANIKKAAQQLIAVDPSIASGITSLESAWNECVGKNHEAQNACLEGCSKELQTGVDTANKSAQAINTAGGASNQTCNQFGDIMRGLQGAFTLFSGACAMTKKSCDSSCGNSVSVLKQLKEAISTGATRCGVSAPCKSAYAKAATKAGLLGLIEKELGSASGYRSQQANATQCDKDFAQRLAGAGTSMAALLGSMMAAKGCNQQTAAAAAAGTGAIDCTLPENQSQMTCVCQREPRTPGCNNNLSEQQQAQNFGTNDSKAKDSATATPTTDAVDPRSPASTAGGSSGDAGMGSGYAGSGAGGNGGVNNKDGAQANTRTIPNSNVLGGVDSGSGGASGFSFSSSSKSAMRDFLPGHSRDPRAISGQYSIPDVTGAGGRNNWDKVRERYKDNRGSLIND